MSKDISILFTARDNLTNSINNMRNSTRNLTKDVTDYKKIQEEAFNKKIEVKLELTKAREELKSLTKAVKENAEGSEQAWKNQQRKIQELESSYKNLSKTAKEASQSERRLAEDINRTKNSNNMNNNSNMLGALGKAGLFSMAGNSLANLGSAALTSMYGEKTGSAVSSIVGGAATGAAIGSVIPGVGTAVGAGVGALIGSLDALTESLKKKDESYKDEVKALYAEVKQGEANTLNNGSTLAAGFETNTVSFTTLLGGKDKADKFLGDIINFAADTPYEQRDLTKISKTLLAYGYKQDEIIPEMTKIGDASGSLGLSGEDTNWIATSLGRMKNTNKATLEYLNPMMERGIKVTEYLSKAFKVPKDDVLKMVSDGLIPGREAAKAIADYMGKEFAGGMEKQSKTFAGMLSALEDNKNMLDMAMGQGFNEERKKGIEQEIEYFTGKLGEKQKEAYSLIGTFKADLENKHQKAIIEAMTNAMESDEFLKAKQEKNGAEMGKIVAEAKAKAEIDYKNSESYKLMQEADLQLVKSIQADTAINNEYLNYGRKMAEQFTKGYSAGINIATEQGKIPKTSINVNGNDNGNKVYTSRFGPSLAVGMDRIPYDNYPILAHQGEKLLTRVEADQQQAKSPIVIHMNNTVREEADIHKIVRAISTELSKAKAGYGGKY